ncbi:MAG: PKD domain-containing protein [Lentimicrobiaceae bacterium]|nr:PKD domain-containing protein [Lentimicrobiaceae bacterium]
MLKFLFVLSLLLSVAKLNAQVTIGGEIAPQKGALLDLNSTFKGGLLLPNVELSDLGEIPDSFTDTEVHNLGVAHDLTGLVVYNTVRSDAAHLQKGIYMWDGEYWRLLAIDGGYMAIPNTTPGYDPLNPIDPDGYGTTGNVQITNPNLNVTGHYSFVIISGSDYSFVYPIDTENGIFSIEFEPNSTAYARNAVLLVTDPAGQTAIFIFTQAGSPCETEVDVTVAAYGSGFLCQNGAVHAYVLDVTPPSIEDYTYFWVRSGVPVAQGAGVELTLPGTYVVYADKIGCGSRGVITVTASTGNTANQASHIIVDNNGILCGATPVTLSALNAPSPPNGLLWIKDGLKQGENTSSFVVPANEASQGVWYLVYDDGVCTSTSSNKINISYTISGTELPTPVPLVNGMLFGDNALTVCSGGTLELLVENFSDYSAFNNVQYEWFGNGESLGRTTSSILYVVSPSFTRLVISLTVTASNQCPVSTTSDEMVVLSGSTPSSSSINRGDERSYICASNPAILNADVTIASTYEWFRNGQKLENSSNPLSVMQPGTYTMRYANAAGCWSLPSPPIEVIQSAPISISWLSMPAAKEIFESSRTYSIITAPDANFIEWAPLDPAHAGIATITKLGNGNAAIVTYSTTEETGFRIKVTATNACGSSELVSDSIHVAPGCIPAGSLITTPNTPQSIKQGESITFTASANTGSAPIYYEWFVAGVSQGPASTSHTFTYTTSIATTPGQYLISVKAYANCNPAIVVTSSSVTLTVTINPALLPPALVAHQTVFYGNKTCLDVHVTNGNVADNPWAEGGRLPLTHRPNDFNNGSQLAFSYNFQGTSISNIRFILSDPQHITQSVSGDVNAPAAIATVTFRSDIRTAAAERTKNTALSVILYAVYDAGGYTYKDSIIIKVQDQSCGCPARVSSNQWQMFQCHNLGADETYDPLNTSNRAALRGAWYGWGRKGPSRDRNNTLVTPVPSGATAPDTWTAYNNPCPSGWVVADEATWRATFSSNTVTVVNGFWRLSNYLLLPPQGYMASLTGGIVDPDGRHYWTGTRVAATTGRNFYRHGAVTVTVEAWGAIAKNYSEPIRCVQAGSAYNDND